MRLAIFGGTFDPIHNAHLAVARAARDSFALDRILVIPAAVPPHKQDRGSEPWHHRYQMVTLACKDQTALQPSDLESGLEKSYSIHTVERVQSDLNEEDQLFFIIGADAFSEIETWYRWNDLVKIVSFIVVNRPGYEAKALPGASILALEGPYMDVSSSIIRDQLASGEKPAELPSGVFEYVREHRLYGFGSRIGGYPWLSVKHYPVSH